MRIGKVFYAVTALGPGKRVAIWTAGCPRRCKGCANPELQTTHADQEVDPAVLLDGIDLAGQEGVTITGGEPFAQPQELYRLVMHLKRVGIDDILVYTGYTMQQLQQMDSDAVRGVLGSIAALVDGEFVQELADETPLRGSSNQQLFVLNPAFKRAYDAYLKTEKRLDIFRLDNGEVHFIGIPPKDYDELYPLYLRQNHTKRSDEGHE